MMKKGFTLVEMLVVFGVLSIVSVLILTIFTRTLRGGNKSQIIATIKQNGQSVLENMDKTVRKSDNVVCPVITPPATSAWSRNLVVVREGIYTRYRIIPKTSASGYIQQDNPTKQTDSQTSKEETESAFVNRICSPVDPMPQAQVLTDTKAQTGVSVQNGLFARDRSAGFKDQVTIRFRITPDVDAPQAVAGQIDPVNFQTTIQLR